MKMGMKKDMRWGILCTDIVGSNRPMMMVILMMEARVKSIVQMES
jgi:hypothetical protein